MSRQRTKRGRRSAAPSNVIELDPGLGAFLASEEGRVLTAEERALLVKLERIQRSSLGWRSPRAAANAPCRWELAILLMRAHVDAKHILARLCEDMELVRMNVMFARCARTKREREQAFKKAREAMKRLGSCRHVLRGCLDDLEAEPLSDVEASEEGAR